MSLEQMTGTVYGPSSLVIPAIKVREYVDATGDDTRRWTDIAPPSYAAALLFVVAPAFIHSEAARGKALRAFRSDLSVARRIAGWRECHGARRDRPGPYQGRNQSGDAEHGGHGPFRGNTARLRFGVCRLRRSGGCTRRLSGQSLGQPPPAATRRPAWWNSQDRDHCRRWRSRRAGSTSCDMPERPATSIPSTGIMAQLVRPESRGRWCTDS